MHESTEVHRIYSAVSYFWWSTGRQPATGGSARAPGAAHPCAGAITATLPRCVSCAFARKGLSVRYPGVLRGPTPASRLCQIQEENELPQIQSVLAAELAVTSAAAVCLA